MALLDIFKKNKKQLRAEETIKRRKGALKQTENAPKPVLKESKGGKKEGNSELASAAIISPYITEKSAVYSERHCYTFKVIPSANKIILKKAIKELYGFDTVKIRIVNIPSKTRFSRGKTGVKSGYKKAMIYLKEGDKIDLG